ncbi:MAG: family 4 glycosyl hydrolase [Promethearchaeota archaeon]
MTSEFDGKITMIGAGSASFGMNTVGDFIAQGVEGLSGATICLHDIDGKNLKRVETVFKMALKEAKDEGEEINYKVESTTVLEDALQDANFIIMSIEHGNRMDTWKQDYYIPISLGSRQIYGENGGIGGMFHTFRQVPPMLKIAEAIKDHCKDAYLFNYSNPLPRVTWSINRYCSRELNWEIKNVGLCHGIGSGLALIEGLFGGVLRKCDVVSAGLNHFYWILKLVAGQSLKIKEYGPFSKEELPAGTDLLPRLKERVMHWASENEAPLIAELMEIYGHLTYPGQSHPGEYIYWADAYCPSVKYDFQSDARGSRDLKKRLQDTVDGKLDNYWWVKRSGERAIPIISGIIHDTGQDEVAVNITNNGSIDRLPVDCVVEVPATVDKSGVHGKKIGRLPRGIESLLLREAHLQDMVVEAAITGDYNTALQALCIDPTCPNPNVGRAILDKFLKVQKHLLPQFNQN